MSVPLRKRPRSPLQIHLDRLVDTFDRSTITPDPLEVVLRYPDPEDAEVFGFYASGLAYGRASQIVKSLDRLAGILGPHPAAFVRHFDFDRDRSLFRGFVHRFHGPRDMALLTEILRRALAEAGGLGPFFEKGLRDEDDDVGPALVSFCDRMTSFDRLPKGPGVTGGRLSDRSPVRYFFSSPRDGSACKRLNLYLRWMVRKDDLDLGLWPSVGTWRLLIPLDTHVARITSYMGLSARATPDWKMACEVTAALREFDPVDPVKYDFAICRLGILDYCPRKRDLVKCEACLLKDVCTL